MVSRPNRGPGQGHLYTYLVSACLAGIECRYDAKSCAKRHVKGLVDKGAALAACPEVLGGLFIPREKSVIKGKDGSAVLMGKARVVTVSRSDVTRNFLSGARCVLSLAMKYGIGKAILKSKSPSCGRRGVTASLLRSKGVKIFSENSKNYAG